MALRIYTKSGGRNYTERKLEKQLTEAINKKIELDPSFEAKWIPATNQEELTQYHLKYCVEDISFVDMPDNAKSKTMGEDGKESLTGLNEDDPGFEEANQGGVNTKKVDPFNRQAPTVRDYVQNSEFSASANPAGTELPDPNENVDFNREPINFTEAFEIPRGEIDSESSTFQTAEEKKINNEKKTSTPPSPSAGVKAPLKEPPLNPSFDSMDNVKKRKGAKKFAKYIVEAVTMLAEKGITWWATKDINDAKIVEYELTGEYNLDMLVSLENGAEISIKGFFANQCKSAEQLAKFEPEEKQDIIDSLTEVLLEKQVAPTPMQELAMTGLTILIKKGLVAFQIQASNKSILEQIMVQNPVRRQPAPQQQAPTPPVQEFETSTADNTSTNENTAPTAYEKFEVTQESIEELIEKGSPIIDNPIATKE